MVSGSSLYSSSPNLPVMVLMSRVSRASMTHMTVLVLPSLAQRNFSTWLRIFAIHQIVAKAGNRNSRIDLINKIGALFAGIKVENHVRIICDIDVRLIIPVKNPACIAINRFSNRNINVENSMPIDFVFF